MENSHKPQTVQEYDGSSFSRACSEMALLISNMERDSADIIRRLFIDHLNVFKMVVFYPSSAEGTDESVCRLCLEPSETFRSILTAAFKLDFDGIRIIDHEIRSLDGVATPG
jgi:hypothetical protein